MFLLRLQSSAMSQVFANPREGRKTATPEDKKQPCPSAVCPVPPSLTITGGELLNTQAGEQNVKTQR